MKFKIGDRVLMKCHSDWKNDIVGTVTSNGRTKTNLLGKDYIVYNIEFDYEQADLTDEMNGLLDRRYSGSTCMEEFLQPLQDINS
jgi:hypothetical protein